MCSRVAHAAPPGLDTKGADVQIENSREARPVFVTGVWKSGNHLVYSALNQLGIEGPFNGIAAHLVFGRFAPVKRVVRGALPGTKGIDVGLETEALIRPGYIAATLRRLRGKIVGGHAAYSDALAEVLRAEGSRMIVIRRDPRDILVSFADWIGSRPDYFMHPDFEGLNREGRVARLLNGGPGDGYPLRPFVEVLTRAEPWLFAGADIFSVGFEELIGPSGGGNRADQERVLQELCAHLGIGFPDSPGWIDSIYGGSLTFNKGRMQRWRELESADLQAEITETLAPHLVRWGYGKEPEEA